MFDDRRVFCACSFMDSVYVIGGYPRRQSCIKFNTNNRQWNEVARLSEGRIKASSTVFEGSIVVSGGDSRTSSTVEAYDHIADSWSFMPNMVEGRSYHKSVAMKNKLFGGRCKTTCELFDSTCNTFVLLKPFPVHLQTYLSFLADVISIVSKLVLLNSVRPKDVLFYDVENDKWTKEPFDVKYNLSGICCAKVPQM